MNLSAAALRRRRQAGQRPLQPLWGPLSTVGGIVAAIEVLTRLDAIPSKYLPPPTRMVEAILAEVVARDFWNDVFITLQAWATGLVVAMLVAVPLGIVGGGNKYLYAGLRPIIEFLRPIPSVALIPLAILVYGIGLTMTVFLVVFAASWPLLLQAMYGMRDVDPVLRDTARSYGLTWGTTFRRITLPSIAPYVLTGVRISSAIALIIAITAQLVVGAPGLGERLAVAQTSGAEEQLYALITVTGLLGYFLNTVLKQAERRLIPWHESVRKEASSA